MALPNFHLPFTIECDASATRIGAVLMQNHHPIAFISQELKNPEKLASAYERKMLAILFAIKKWRLETKAQHTWLLKLHNYNFRLEYTKGKENLVADGLSRREEEENNNCFGISAVQAN